MEITNKIPLSFDATIENLIPLLKYPGKSLARIRTFYGGINRNFSIITEEVTKQLIESAPGTPIIGKYNIETQDFESHMTINDTRAYGFIDKPSNFSLEKHIDKDGIEREYVCFDVILWTNRYEEAGLIPGKSISMELDKNSVEGNWSVFNGEYYFKYTKARLLGICILGNNVEPCFEGAAAFSLNGDENEKSNFYVFLREMRNEINNNFQLLKEKTFDGEDKEDKKKVNDLKFDMPNSTTISSIFSSCMVNDSNSITAIPFGCVDNNYYTWQGDGNKEIYRSHSFTIKDNKIENEKSYDVHPIFMTEEDFTLYNKMLGGRPVSELSIEYEKLKEKESNGNVSKVEYDELKNNYDIVVEKLSTYELIVKQMQEAEKTSLIDSYTLDIDEAFIKNIREKQDSYSLKDLEALLAVEYARTNREKKNSKVSMISDDKDPESFTGSRALIEQYKRIREAK